MGAASEGHVEVVNHLVDKRANIDLQAENGNDLRGMGMKRCWPVPPIYLIIKREFVQSFYY